MAMGCQSVANLSFSFFFALLVIANDIMNAFVLFPDAAALPSSPFLHRGRERVGSSICGRTLDLQSMLLPFSLTRNDPSSSALCLPLCKCGAANVQTKALQMYSAELICLEEVA